MVIACVRFGTGGAGSAYDDALAAADLDGHRTECERTVVHHRVGEPGEIALAASAGAANELRETRSSEARTVVIIFFMTFSR